MKRNSEMSDQPDQLDVFPTSVDLTRIDGEMNMRQFYRICLQPDLFGGVTLVREWERIGFRGQSMTMRHADEGEAVTALMKLAATKTRRGYRDAREGGTPEADGEE